MSGSTNYCPRCEQLARERDAARAALDRFSTTVAREVNAAVEEEREACAAIAARYEENPDKLIRGYAYEGDEWPAFRAGATSVAAAIVSAIRAGREET